MHSTERGFLLVERNVALHPFGMEAVSRGFPLAPAPARRIRVRPPASPAR